MGKREDDERLSKIRENGGKIYSISRLNTLHQCPYQAYLRYVKGINGHSSVWGILGGRVHDALEAVIHGEDEEAIGQSIQSELDNLELLGLDFPLDSRGNPTIRRNWVANMELFAKNFKRPKGEFETEQLVLMKVKDKAYMQGYIDLIRKNSDGTISIFDWKTSSNFDKKHLIEAGRQLVFYAMAKAGEGFKVRDIAWVMLKYCEVNWNAKNGKRQSMICEWRDLGRKMKNRVKKDLTSLEYDDMEIEVLLDKMIKRNDLSMMPEEIQEKYSVKPYVRRYDLTDEVIEETKSYIENTINMYETWGDDEKKYDHIDCWEESFFCANLCGYGGKDCKCKHYGEYYTDFVEDVDELDSLFG